MIRRKPAAKADNHERWLITYADLITLLLVLFIVLYAGSQADANKFAILASGLRSAFHNVADNGAGGSSPVFAGTGSSNAAGSSQELADFNRLSAIVEGNSVPQGLGSQVAVQRDAEGITISLTGDLLFSSGEAALKPAAIAVLDSIAGALKPLPNQIRVEGYTDNVPIGGTEFASNWELSAARATAVLRHLIDDGIAPDRVFAAAYGDTRPRADNSTPPGRAQNRRAQIVVLYPPSGTQPQASPTPQAGR